MKVKLLSAAILVIAASGVLLFTNTASSAGIAWVDINNPLHMRLKITGAIVPGDYEKLSKGLKQLTERPKVVIIDSEGGDLATAMKMGRLLRREKVQAFIGTPMICNSACVFLLIGAPFRMALGSVGIHRPYYPLDTETSVEGQRRQHQYLEKITSAYLAEMNIPATLYDEMIRIPPDEIKVLSAAELARYGLNHDDPDYADAQYATVAKRIGISVQELLTRIARQHDVCERPPISYSGEDVERCYQRIVYEGSLQ